MITTKNLKMLGTLVLGLSAGAAFAGQMFWNMDTDPTVSAGFQISGIHTSFWYPTGGNPDTGGYLSIADGGQNGQNLVVVFPSIDVVGGVAYPVKAFHLTADMRVGNPQGCGGRPADGFSLSYCRENDNILINMTNATPTAPITTGAAGGDGCPTPATGSGDFENGCATGVAVIFDAWAGNNLPDTGPGGTCGPDTEGVEVRVDDHTLTQINMQSDRNGNCSVDANQDPTVCGTTGGMPGVPPLGGAVCSDCGTEQTGACWEDGGSYTNLCWARIDIELNTNAQVTVIWKGCTLLDHFQLSNFNTYKGRLVLMGRNGGCNQNVHIDNINLVTIPDVAATFGFVKAGPGLNAFTFTMDDNGPATVTNVSLVRLDGVDVTSSVTTTHSGTVTTGVYTQAANFPSGSTHKVDVTFQDSLGDNISVVGQSFSIGQWIAIPALYSVPAASVDLTRPGFLVKPTQTTNSVEPNRQYWADEQLEGVQGANQIDFTSVINATNNNEVAWNSVVDVANGAAPNGEFSGNSNNDQSWALLGIPAPNTAFATPEDNCAAAFMGYGYFPTAGTYTFGGNSDDGISLHFVQNSHDLIGIEVPGMTADVGRGIGNDQNQGSVVISTPGYYGMRFLFENGTGGCNVEFYTRFTPASGTKNILVNDTNTPNYLQVYMVSTAGPAYISYAEPPALDDQVRADVTLTYDISDSGTTVSGTPTVSVNGTAQTATITHPSAGVTHITVAPSPLWPAGTNAVSIAFTDSAGPRSYNYSFIVQPYVTLDPSLAGALGSQDTTKPGFILHVTQVDPCLPIVINPSGPDDCGDGTVNDIDSANAMMAGAYYPWYGTNAADVSTAVSGNMWNWTLPIDFDIVNAGGTFTNNYPLPGIPSNDGTTQTARRPNDSFSIWLDGYLVISNAGYYVMVVASDDAFRITEGIGVSRQLLTVAGTNVNRVVAAAPSGAVNVGGVWQGVLPTTPISGPVVYVDSSQCPAWTTMNLAGAVALIDADRCGANPDNAGNNYNNLVAQCQAQGAIACIVEASPGWGTPETMGGGTNIITIPALHTSGFNGEKDWWHTNGPLTATIGADANLMLGQADYGKGNNPINVPIYVPQAGVYPMHMTYEQGGGGAGLEWYVVAADGTATLINDTSTPGSLLAYRAATIAQKPTISVAKVGSTWQITFTGGVLRSSATVNGTYSLVPGNPTSPYTVPTGTGAAQFYRAASN